jgi:hypothetical protein
LLFIGYSKNKKIMQEIIDMSHCMAVAFQMAYGAYSVPWLHRYFISAYARGVLSTFIGLQVLFS